MKYCCNDFKLTSERPNTTNPAIRIVKYLPKDDWDKNKLYLGFYVTSGYEIFRLEQPKLDMLFCPFCGTNLKKFYSSNVDPNENEGTTFTLE